jgi:predicted phage terminase large subunit-like protein
MAATMMEPQPSNSIYPTTDAGRRTKKKKADGAGKRPKPLKIGPQPGSQERFLASRADIVFYGGEAGSSKTAGLVLEGLRCHDIPKSGGIMFRRTSPQLEGPGSLWELMREWYPALGARMTESPVFKAVFPSGASVQLGHLQYEATKLAHQGKGYSFIGFDELTHFTEGQFWYLFSRCRSTSGVRSYIRATMNPDPDSWVKKMIAWWLDERGEYARPERSGVIRYFYRVGESLDWGDSIEELRAQHPEQEDPPSSFTFILGKLADNKILLALDPGYRARLMALPLVDRERLLGKGKGGNWRIKPAAGLYFRRGWFNLIEQRPTDIVQLVRAWDKAATQPTAENPDPAWTRGVLMGITRAGRICVLHLESLRGSPNKVLETMKNIAKQDGQRVKVLLWQDPAQAGKVDVMLSKGFLMGFHVESEVAREDKIVYAGPFSTQVEAGNVDVLAGAWNDDFFTEMEGFPDGKHKDIVDACSRGFMGLAKAGVLAYQKAMANVSLELSP